MHIPDGFLSTPVWVTLDAVSIPVVAYLARRAQQTTQETSVPLLGVMGAFVFAAQMVNFPVGAGTSGHLLGGALLAYTLGPAQASVVMTAILALQALVFQDGGILALGANVINMALAGVFAGYLPFRLWGDGPYRKFAVFLGGVLSVLTGAVLAMGQLLASGIPMPGPVVGISLGLFGITAILEGAITVAIMGALELMRPRFLSSPRERGGIALWVAVAAALVLAGVGVFYASSHPDGLEKLSMSLGIQSQERNLLSTPLSGYETSLFHSEWLRKSSAGLAGLVLVFGLVILISRFLIRRRST